MTTVRRVSADIDPARPAPARVYDYLLGGGYNFESDRDAANHVMTLVPEIRDCAWSNRGFHQRAARWIAEHGVRQFIDIGSGLPTVGNTHEVVQLVDPQCRVVYVDNDPMVRTHAEELLSDPSRVRVVQGDLRQPEELFDSPDTRELIDFSQPTGLLMTAVVHFVSDDKVPGDLINRCVAKLAPGSYLSLSHLTDDHKPERAVGAFCKAFEHATEQLHFRSMAEIERLFDGLELVPPTAGDKAGRLCYAGDWGAEDPVLADSDGSRWLVCGVAKVPEPASTES
jgi:O-methyltransferase involved in polyketide biosynthesis